LSVLSRSEEIGLVGPAIAIIVGIMIMWSNYVIQRWRFRVDRLNVAIDHLSIEINGAADLATEYWLTVPGTAEGVRKIAFLEPKLIGMQTRLSSLLLAIETLDDRVQTRDAWDRLATLFDAMTGANFKTPGRPADPDRAQSAQSVGAELVGDIRAAAARRSREWWSPRRPT
jgi:hypothetical protein